MIFVDFRLTKNILFNKTESFIGRNNGNHACQIFCSKSNCETMYHWFFLLEITVVKKMNNLNVSSAHSYLYPRSRFKHCDITIEIPHINIFLIAGIWCCNREMSQNWIAIHFVFKIFQDEYLRFICKYFTNLSFTHGIY